MDFYQFNNLKKYKNIFHGVSKKSNYYPYKFSLALHTGEDSRDIILNREELSKFIDSSKSLKFIVANQTHSSNIKIITEKETKGWETIDDAIENCDALITDLEEVALSILTADCVPIILYDNQKGIVASIHAGWRGTASQIVYKTIEKMKERYNTNPKDIIAGVAPSIGKCCYQVGEDVAKYFFDLPESFTSIEDKYMLDLPYINREQLLKAGVLEDNIEMSNICTSCNVDNFFSYRKEKGCSGRFMTIIGLRTSRI